MNPLCKCGRPAHQMPCPDDQFEVKFKLDRIELKIGLINDAIHGKDGARAKAVEILKQLEMDRQRVAENKLSMTYFFQNLDHLQRAIACLEGWK